MPLLGGHIADDSSSNSVESLDAIQFDSGVPAPYAMGEILHDPGKAALRKPQLFQPPGEAAQKVILWLKNTGLRRDRLIESLDAMQPARVMDKALPVIGIRRISMQGAM